MPEFMEGQKVVLIDEPIVVGKVDATRYFTDPDTDRITGAPSYLVAWEDGNYSEHTEDELQAATEEL